MAEVVGLVTSVIQVASSGVKLSRTLRDYGSAVQGYEKRLKGLDKDIYFTSGIISELATLLKNPRVQSLVSERSIELTREIVAEFEGMSQAIEDIIEAIRADSMGKWKIYFRESKIKLLLSNLDRLKGNLQLLIGVITHASQISTEHPDDPAMASHRIKILELMVEKEEYTLKYLEEKRKYDNLMVHVNSNSTLGSMSTIHTENGATATWDSTSLCPESPAERGSASDEPSGNGLKGKGVVTPQSHQVMLAAIDESEMLDDEAERRMENIGRLKSELMQLKDDRAHAENSPTVHRFSSAQPANLNNHGSDRITPNITDIEETVNAQEPPVEDPVTAWGSHQKQAFASLERAKHKPARPRKRDVASRVGKRVIKGTGYAIVGAFAVITFPITIPAMWWLWPRQRRSSGGAMPMSGGVGGYMSEPVWSYSPTHHRRTELFDPDDFGDRAEVRLMGRLTNVPI